MYLVAACSDTSTPRAKASHPSGVAQVLSATSNAPWAWAAAARAGTSCISKVSEPAASTNTTRVLACSSSLIPAPSSGS